MTVFMYDGSHGRHEGADVDMPNADIDSTASRHLPVHSRVLVLYLHPRKVKQCI